MDVQTEGPTQLSPETTQFYKDAAESQLKPKSTGKLAKALAKAQSEFKAVNKSKTAKGQSFSYKYADLNDVLEMAIPLLSKNGIAFMQPLVRVGDKTYVITRLQLDDEIMEDAGLPIPAQVKPQELGMYVSYYRRYLVSSFLGISADEDTDGPPQDNKPTQPSVSVQPEVKKDPRKVIKSEPKKEEPAPQVQTTAQPSENLNGVVATDEDIPNNISSVPDAGQRKDYIARLKDLIGKSSKDGVQHFIAGVVGGEFTTSTLTKAQWDQSLVALETADKEGKLKEVLNG